MFGFIDFGAADIENNKPGPDYFENYLSSGFQASMGYLERNLDKRVDPRLLVDGAKSVLCFLAPYGPAGGGVAGFAQGEDYHTAIKRRLAAVAGFLSEEYEGFSGRAFVDSAPVMERLWAVRAGLGFIGKNGFLISPKWGLRVIIGIIICNIPADRFAPHAPLEATDCGGCGRCLKACPGSALTEGCSTSGTLLDARKCISYHTVESRELYDVRPVDYRGWIFGCEECVNVCPWNKEIAPLPELETNREYIASLSKEDWMEMSQEEFDGKFAGSGLTRAGLAKIKNNCL